MNYSIILINLSIIFISIGLFFMDRRISRNIDFLQDELLKIKMEMLDIQIKFLQDID